MADQIPATRLAQLRGQPNIKLVSRETVGSPFTYSLNTTKAPFTERDVRIAFQSAVDTEAITQGLFQGTYTSGRSVLTSSTPGYDKSVEQIWGYDKNRAISTLEKAGFTTTDSEGYRTRDGQRLSVTLAFAASFTTEEQRNYHTALKDAVKQVGFEVVLRPLDTPSIVQTFASGDYHLGSGAPSAIDGSILRTLFYSSQLPGVGGANAARVNDPEIDGWLDEALRTRDVAGQNALYGKVQRKALTEAYVLPTFVSKRTYGVQQRVQGFELGAGNLPVLPDVWVS